MDRIERLHARVAWLDRWRHYLAVIAALAGLPYFERSIAELLGADWPAMHVAFLVVMLSAITWFVAECSFAWIAAVWEARHDALVRDRPHADWPRAHLVRR